ncbi:MAG: uracil phosphoribosyltransferase [Bacteroidetes bacterium]|nr:uracil phosphoribosyltransferase [Bacteroidota bacterium]MBU1720281.1 uracil phosphoribosyltransferase [Bacteroidota bacterium]
MIIELGKQTSVLNQYIAELRDAEIQKDSMRFRANMQRFGQIVAYEISKELKYVEKEVITPLGSSVCPVLADEIVIATILRAGLPLHLGILDIFDKSRNAFVSAYRRMHKSGKFDIAVEYISSPSITDRVLILSDPMMATGKSMLLTYKSLLTKGKPKHTHIVMVLASTEGVEYLRKNVNMDNITLWIGAIDEELTAQAYIVPGLGDAGDLAFGGKDDRLDVE